MAWHGGTESRLSAKVRRADVDERRWLRLSSTPSTNEMRTCWQAEVEESKLVSFRQLLNA